MQPKAIFPPQPDKIETPQVSTQYKATEMDLDQQTQDRLQNVLSRESYPWGDNQSKRYSLKSQTGGAGQHRVNNFPLDPGATHTRNKQAQRLQNQTQSINAHLDWEQQQPTVETSDNLIFSHDDFYEINEQRVGTSGKYSEFSPEAQQQIIKQQKTKLMD